MKFLEYKAKEIFARYRIPVPQGVVAASPADILDPPLPCMVKAQVLVGGRGKAGGIKAAESLDEARTVAGQILGMDIHGFRVKQVYLEERLEILCGRLHVETERFAYPIRILDRWRAPVKGMRAAVARR